LGWISLSVMPYMAQLLVDKALTGMGEVFSLEISDSCAIYGTANTVYQHW
jgi:hypothetical protein